MRNSRSFWKINPRLPVCGLLIALAAGCQTRQGDTLASGSIVCSGKVISEPKAERAWQHKTFGDQSIVVSIAADTTLYLGRDRTTQEDLGRDLKGAIGANHLARVFLQIDQMVQYGIVATVADIAFDASAERLFFIVDKGTTNPPYVYGFDSAKPVNLYQPTDALELSMKQGENQGIEYGINSKPFSSMNDLLVVLADLMTTRPAFSRAFLVKPATDVSYGDVIALMDGATTTDTETFTLWTPKFEGAFPRPIASGEISIQTRKLKVNS